MFISQSKYDKVVKERDDIRSENDTLITERNQAVQERDMLQTENDTLNTECNTAIQERDHLQAQIDTTNEESSDVATLALNETFENLDELDDSIQSADTPEAKTTAVVSLVSTLRQSSGAKPARLQSKTETKPTYSEKDENVTSEKKSFSENLESISKEFL